LEKLNPKPSSSEETIQADPWHRSVETIREEEVKLRRVGFVKEVGFKPGMKQTEREL